MFRFFQKQKKINYKNLVLIIFSILLSVCTVVGHMLAKTQSLYLLFETPGAFMYSIFKFLLLVIFFYCATSIFMHVTERPKLVNWSAKPRTPIVVFLSRSGFKVTFLLIFIIWLPYLIAYYPGIFMGDTSAQISQFFQLPNGASNYLNLISPDQLITNHHPVVHTLMLGGFTKLGEVFFHSDNIGIFMYTLLQYTVCSATLAYSLQYMKKLNAPGWFRSLAFLLYAFFPVFPRYAVLLSKDAYFACFTLLFVLLLLDWIREPESMAASRAKQAAFILAMLGTMLFRQNGILVVVFALPLLLLHKKKNPVFRRILLSFVCGLGIYMLYMQILLPAFQITPGSKREILSIPFQQTARYLTQYPDEVTPAEHDAIDAVLDYDYISSHYNSELADPVKNTYNENATSSDLKNYFRTWFSMFFKHPGVYISATLNNYYGYFYIGNDAADHHVRYYMDLSTRFMDKRMNHKGFHFHHLTCMQPLAVSLELIADYCQELPVLSLFESSGFYSIGLLLVFACLLLKKKWAGLIAVLPALSIYLVCFISPANGIYYFRYAFPLAYLLPALTPLCMENDTAARHAAYPAVPKDDTLNVLL